MSNLVAEYLKSKQTVDQKSTGIDSSKSDKIKDLVAIQKPEVQDSQIISRNILVRKIWTKNLLKQTLLGMKFLLII